MKHKVSKRDDSDCINFKQSLTHNNTDQNLADISVPSSGNDNTMVGEVVEAIISLGSMGNFLPSDENAHKLTASCPPSVPITISSTKVKRRNCIAIKGIFETKYGKFRIQLNKVKNSKLTKRFTKNVDDKELGMLSSSYI